jgi:cytochrome c5
VKLNTVFKSVPPRRAPILAVVLAALGLSLAACARGGLPTASDADAARVRGSWPTVTAAQLNQGRGLYQAHCSTCHLPVSPTRFAPAEWPGHVHEMQERAGLSPAEAALVEQYVVSLASRPAGE